MDQLSFRVANHGVSFESDIPGVAGIVSKYLEGFTVDGADLERLSPSVTSARYGLFWQEGGVSLDIDGRRYVSERVEPALSKLFRELSYTGICSVRDRLVIHAGAVAYRGHCVILPAASGSGKSTFTAALVRAGWTYLSDEAAFLDLCTGIVEPFARPIGLSEASCRRLGIASLEYPGGLKWADGEERQVAPEALRRGSTGPGAPLQVVVTPRYQPGGTGEAQVTRRGEGVIAVIRNSTNFKAFGEEGLLRLAEIMRNVDTYRLTVDDLGAAVQSLTEIIEQLPAEK